LIAFRSQEPGHQVPGIGRLNDPFACSGKPRLKTLFSVVSHQFSLTPDS